MGSEFEVFDLQRMFLGDQSSWFLLEVVFRTGFMFVYTFILVRTTGKRGLGELSPFELLLVVALGSAVGDPMFYPEVPLLHAMVVVAVIVLLQRALALATDHSRHAERLLEGTSRRLVADGVLDLKAMRAERFAREELFMLLREEGVEQLGQVKRAYLEPSGRVSTWLFRREDVAPGLPLVPPDDPEYPQPLRPEEQAIESATFACVACGSALDTSRGETFGPCSKCEGEDGWIRASSEPGGDDEDGGRGRQHRHRGPLGR